MAEETTSAAPATESSAAPETSEQTTDEQQASSTEQHTDNTPDIDALVQRAVDRATNKLGNENKKLRGQIDELKKAKLTDDERKQLDIQEKEQEIAEREQRLSEKENRLVAIKAIKDAGLDDGSSDSLALVDFVMAGDEKQISERVTAFSALVKKFVQTEVEKRFKANGRTPGVGTGSTTDGTPKPESVAVRIGRNAAQVNKASQSTLDYYLGGNKK